MPSNQQLMHAEQQLTTTLGHVIQGQVWRPAAPKAVVALCHGLGEHSGRYQNVVGELGRRGYAIYAIDHRGHGRTPGRRAAIMAWQELHAGVAALIGWIDAAEPGLPVFLYGHSLGGLIAAEYAIRSPGNLCGLVLSAPALSSEGISPVIAMLSRLLSKVAPQLQIQNGLPIAGISRDPAVQQAYTSDPLNHGYGTPRLATESFATIAWVNAHAARLELPTLIIHGDADPIVPPAASARFAAAIGASDVIRISYPTMVHEPHNDLGWEQPVRDIANWLDDHVTA